MKQKAYAAAGVDLVNHCVNDIAVLGADAGLLPKG
jgi:phosphoribosylaminoimidazole (AIR) synthetase